MSSFSHVENALKSCLPVVCLDRVPPSLKVDSVCADNVAGAKECVAHLIEMGHRDIAVLTGPQSLDNERERLRGYQLALNDANIQLRPELVWAGTFPLEKASQVCEEKLSRLKLRPTAVFTTSGLMAIAFLETMHNMGLRCPEDIALATFDELTAVKLFEPSITTVVQPAYKIGWEGARLLIGRIQKKTVGGKPIRIRLPAVLQVRNSSARLRGASLSEQATR
jgi:LacI family transcriptional regulator